KNKSRGRRLFGCSLSPLIFVVEFTRVPPPLTQYPQPQKVAVRGSRCTYGGTQQTNRRVDLVRTNRVHSEYQSQLNLTVTRPGNKAAHLIRRLRKRDKEGNKFP